MCTVERNSSAFVRAFCRLFSFVVVLSFLVTPVRAGADGDRYDVGAIYSMPGGVNVGDAFVFSFPTSDWNLLRASSGTDSSSDETGFVPVLAGWNFFQELPYRDGFSDEFIARRGDDVRVLSEKLALEGGGDFVAAGYSDGHSSCSMLKLDDGGNSLCVGKLRHSRAGEGPSVSAAVLVRSGDIEIDGISADGCELPSNGAQLALSGRVGKVKVWGEFRINDWNGLTEKAVTPAGKTGGGAVTAAAALGADGASLDTPHVPGSYESAVEIGVGTSFELGAAFPSSSGVGILKYRRSSDDGGSLQLEREHLGLSGEVDIRHDIRVKAGVERVHSNMGGYQSNEKNVWTGIEMDF